jgi:GT2 family glycosyltransferase
VNAATDADRSLKDDLNRDVGTLDPVVRLSPENLGFAFAHNAALAALFDLGCDAVLVLNPDVVLEPAALEELAATARSMRPGPALFGPVLELADPTTLRATALTDTRGIRWSADGRHFDVGQGAPVGDPREDVMLVDGVSGAALLVPRETYDLLVSETGEFFDADFIAYREDAELAFRASLLGVRSFVVHAARGRHVRRLRGTTRGLDAQIDMLGVRNRFLIAFKYGRGRPGRMPLPYVRDAVVVLAVLLRERSSIPGLRDAWRLRHTMWAKGARIRAAAARPK